MAISFLFDASTNDAMLRKMRSIKNGTQVKHDFVLTKFTIFFIIISNNFHPRAVYLTNGT